MKSTAKKSSSPAIRGPVVSTSHAGTRVLLVDDHPLLRESMKILIEERSKFEVCGEADNVPNAIEVAGRLVPDIIVADISLGSNNGIELTKALRAQAPAMRILVVSMHDEGVYAERALRAGAMGYLMKDRAGEELITAIECLMTGEFYVSDRLKEKMVQQFLTGEKSAALAGTLSDRELKVLDLIGNGMETRAIADKLKLSTKTINSYREYLELKEKMAGDSELVHRAIQWARGQGGR